MSREFVAGVAFFDVRLGPPAGTIGYHALSILRRTSEAGEVECLLLISPSMTSRTLRASYALATESGLPYCGKFKLRVESSEDVLAEADRLINDWLKRLRP